jgi:hypothetical protein
VDAGRLLEVLADFAAEVAAQGIPAALQAVVSTFQQAISNPAVEGQFKDALSRLFEILEKCPSNSWPPSKRLILESSGLSQLTGRVLRQRLNASLTKDAVLRAPVQNDLNAALQELQRRSTEAAQAVSILQSAGVRPHRAPEDKAEIGFLLPDTIDTKSIDAIEKELKNIDLLLRALGELHGETVASSEVIDLSAGSLAVFVGAGYAVARALLDLVERVLNIWQKVIDLKRQQRALEASQVPESILRDLKEHIDGRVSIEAAKIAKEAVAQSSIAEARKNELENQLRFCIKVLAARIDRGAKVEATVLIEKTAGAADADEQKQVIAAKGALMNDTPQLEQPVLALTLDTDGTSSEQGPPRAAP